ncbi:MAG: ABC transporter ATP-binding protein [Pseudomonadota bacterium]
MNATVSRLTAPVKRVIIIACVIQGIGAAAGVVPFIAVAELGRVLLAETVDQTAAWRIAYVAVAALALRLVCLMAAGALTHVADLDFQYHLRTRMAARLSRAPLGWFDARSAGMIKKALQDDVTALHHLVGHSYTNMVSALVTPLVALSYLFWIDWLFTLAALVPVVAGVALYGLQYRGYGEKMAAYNAALGNVNTAAVEFVQGIAVIKTFGQAQKAYGRFLSHTQDFVRYFWEWVRGLLAIAAAAEVVLSPLFALLAVLVAGLLLVMAGLTEPVNVLAFAVLAPGLTAPIMTLAYSQNEMMLATQAAGRIVDLLDTAVLSETANPREPQGSRVVFDDVSFSYDHETQVLKNVDLTLEPGTVTALVGPSGSGKSTLARLLPRFWDVDSGVVTIGGVPVGEMTPDTLYRTVSFVFQDVQLLRSSIADNIALARPNASRAEIEDAARAAQIHERILGLPRGYDSVAGEDAHLSGGEAQRVSIARALLADAPIIVLDEATAFADPDCEAAIQDALSRLVAGRTLLVIAHRLHTITGAEQICVIDEGCIVERGTHEELIGRRGLYAKLWAAHESPLAETPEAAK